MGDGLAIAALAFAAVSAAASAAAAAASWRSIRLSRTPRLVCTPDLVDGNLSKVTVTNAGLGSALRVYLFLVLGDEQFTAAGIETNVIPADGRFTAHPKFTTPVKVHPSDASRLRGFTACFDVYGRPYARSLEDEPIGGLREWRGLRRRAKEIDAYEVLSWRYGTEYAERVRSMPRVGDAN